MHNIIWVSTTMVTFRKKLIMEFQENARIEGQTEGRKDERLYFIGSFRLSVVVQKANKI